MSEVACEWRDHEGAQRVTPAHCSCLPRPSRNESPQHPKPEVEGRGPHNYNATTDDALWPDPLGEILVGRASITSGQRS
jgi:hypothetical protein